MPILASTRPGTSGHEPALASITILGSGRLGPTLSALLGLAGTVIGGLALLRRPADRGQAGSRLAGIVQRQGATTALALGVISLVLGIVFLAAADAGPGTGNGVVGSAAAIVLGPIAVGLGVLARARRGRVGPVSPGRSIT